MTRNSRRALLHRLATVAAASGLAGCQAPAKTPGGGTTESTPSPTQTATATATRTETPTPTPADVEGVLVEGTEFEFDPSKLQAAVGEELTVTFRNVGSIAHNFAVGKFPLSEHDVAWQDENEAIAARTKTIQQGKTDTVSFTPEQTGTFPFWCDVSGHRDAGMYGEIIVE